jgi:hypothetical protein
MAGTKSPIHIFFRMITPLPDKLSATYSTGCPCCPRSFPASALSAEKGRSGLIIQCLDWLICEDFAASTCGRDLIRSYAYIKVFDRFIFHKMLVVDLNAQFWGALINNFYPRGNSNGFQYEDQAFYHAIYCVHSSLSLEQDCLLSIYTQQALKDNRMLISIHLASYKPEAFIGRSRRERAQSKCVLASQLDLPHKVGSKLDLKSYLNWKEVSGSTQIS